MEILRTEQCLAILRFAVSCPALSCPAISCLAISCLAVSGPAISCQSFSAPSKRSSVTSISDCTLYFDIFLFVIKPF